MPRKRKKGRKKEKKHKKIKRKKRKKMSITIELNHREPRDETRQKAFITVSGVDSYAFKFQVGDVPIELTTDQEVQDHLDGREDEFHLFCLKKTWTEADPWDFKDPEKSELQNFLDWIDAGHKNKILVGTDPETDEPVYDYVVVENHIYEGTHPLRYPPAEDVLQEALDLLADFSDTTFQELADRIEDDLTSVPKVREYLVELSKAFLALIRYMDHKDP